MHARFFNFPLFLSSFTSNLQSFCFSVGVGLSWICLVGKRFQLWVYLSSFLWFYFEYSSLFIYRVRWDEVRFYELFCFFLFLFLFLNSGYCWCCDLDLGVLFVEGVRAGAKAAAVTCIVTAVPTVSKCTHIFSHTHSWMMDSSFV